MKRPWEKFYYSDWRADPALGMCSLAARGLWLEMLALMHEAEPRGHLLINGNLPDETQLAALARCPSDQVPVLLAELEKAGVFNRRRDRVIYSRRQVRDEKKRKDGEKTAKNGTLPDSRRGRQAIDKTGGNSTTHGVDDTVVDQTPPHPEARGYIPERKPPDPQGDDFMEFYKAYPRPEDKEAARKAYKAVRKLTSHAEILSAAKRYAAEKKGTERQYIKLPATWLRAGSWANGDTAEQNQPTYSDELWQTFLISWGEGKPWPATQRGPAPNDPGCLVPERLLKRYSDKFGDLAPGHLSKAIEEDAA